MRTTHDVTTAEAADERLDSELLSAVIIGAGLGGVAVAHHLVRAGIRQFVVLEQAAGVGGSWWDNRYPGAECDVSSELYSYSFRPRVFSRTHARQPALQEYIEDVVKEDGFEGNLRLSTCVRTVTWDSKDRLWSVEAEDGRCWRARFVVSAVGQLNNPRYPEWPGLDTFRGQCFHTARWQAEFDPRGKTVAVVGTGSTSAQVVPALAEHAEQLYLYQRQPGWVLPKLDRNYDQDELRRLRRFALVRKLRRLRLFVNIERLKPVAKADGAVNKRMERAARDYIAETITDPAVRAAVTPTYPFYGKRIVLSGDFYPALNRPNVTLVPHAVTALTQTGVVDGTGTERAADAVVMATGFWPMKFLATFDVVGPNGITLGGYWGDEPRAFLGLMVPSFPNFFMLYGPNTNGGDVLFMLERQAEWVARAIKRARRRDAGTVEVRERLFEWVDRKVNQKNNGTVWIEASNYYKGPTGRIVTQWPYRQSLYWLLLRVLDSRVACRWGPTSGGPSPGHATERPLALAAQR